MNRNPRLGILSPGLSLQLYNIILLYDCGHLTTVSLSDFICAVGTDSRIGKVERFHATFL